MDKVKDQFDIIYLLDSELGIDSGHSTERPCIVIAIYDDGSGAVVPISSQRPNRTDHSKGQLAFGSGIDFSNTPIRITEAQMTYSRLGDINMSIDGEDIEQLEYRYSEGV